MFSPMVPRCFSAVVQRCRHDWYQTCGDTPDGRESFIILVTSCWPVVASGMDSMSMSTSAHVQYADRSGSPGCGLMNAPSGPSANMMTPCSGKVPWLAAWNRGRRLMCCSARRCASLLDHQVQSILEVDLESAHPSSFHYGIRLLLVQALPDELHKILPRARFAPFYPYLVGATARAGCLAC